MAPNANPWRTGWRRDAVTAVALAALTAAVFAPAAACGWTNFDDKDYVTENPHVTAGLTSATAAWAFTTFHNANWHPLTWLSLQLDASLGGTAPRGFHVTNVAIHAANAALLFLALRTLTGAFWRSVAVALLFAVHPLRAESVAWVSERKDVLSAFFGLLALWAYAAYARRPGRRPYVAIVVALALSLLCKPMFVTLPCLFLVLDWWPLRRVGNEPAASDRQTETPRLPAFGNGLAGQSRRKQARAVAAAAQARPATAGSATPDVISPVPVPVASAPATRRAWERLVVEKLPLFALVAASALVTYLAQAAGGAVGNLTRFSLPLRLENAVLSYVAYLAKSAWPVNLSPFYMHPGQMDNPPADWEPIGAAVFLLAVTVAAVLLRKRAPYVLTGWLWYVGTLVPVIGLVQVGNQGMADRYTYFPQIGVLLALCWGVADVAGRHVRVVVPVAVGAALVLAYRTTEQVAIWHDSGTLWRHAIVATGGGEVELLNLGGFLEEEGKFAAAADNYREILRDHPKSFRALSNLGNLTSEAGDQETAQKLVEQALALDPNYALAHTVLGGILYRQGRYEEAKREHELALKIQPELWGAWSNLGATEMSLGDHKRAIACYREAIRRKPDFAEAHSLLGNLLVNHGNATEKEDGLAHLRAAVRYKPDYADGHINLGKALVLRQDLGGAVREFEQAVQLADRERARQQAAGQLLPSAPVNATLALAWYNLGAAFAVQGRPEPALDSLRKAAELDGRYREWLEKYRESLKAHP